MKTIKQSISKEFIIQKSKFIAKLYPVFSKKEIDAILKKLNQEYKDATHICYAYILETEKRAHDDGEPSGTAGMPMLHVLEQKDLTFILAVIIRYFGGIKLGAGGLVRAYSNCLSQSIEEESITNIQHGIIVDLVYDYSKSKSIDNLLEPYTILQKSFSEKIKITVKLKETDYQSIKEILIRLCDNVTEKERLFIY